MMTSLHLLLSGLPLLLLGVLVLKTVIETTLAIRKYKKILTSGVPLVEGYSLLGGHLLSVLMAPCLPRTIDELHAKYGKYFALLQGPHLLVLTTDLDLLKRVAVSEGQQHTDRRFLDIPLGEFMDDCLVTAKGEQWRRLRRAFAPAFTHTQVMRPRVTREIEASIRKFIDTLEWKLNSQYIDCNSMSLNGDANKELWEVEVDMEDLVRRYTLDLSLRCLYKCENCIDFRAPQDRWVELVSMGQRALLESPIVKLCSVLPPLRRPIDGLLYHLAPQSSIRKEIKEFVEHQVSLRLRARKQLERDQAQLNMKQKEHLCEQLEEENFLLEDGTQFARNLTDSIADQFLDGKLGRAEYFNSARFLVTAADKTSAEVICHTLYQLAVNQRVQEKLLIELQMADIHCEYLTWVINESLRLLPPVGGGCGRVVTRDIQLEGGGIIPAGAMIAAHTGTVHRLREFWGEDADEYKPERFAKAAQFHPMQFIPFGAGIRECPGREFAMREIKLLLRELLFKYKFRCAAKENCAYDAPMLVLTIQQSPTLIRVSRRQH